MNRRAALPHFATSGIVKILWAGLLLRVFNLDLVNISGDRAEQFSAFQASSKDWSDNIRSIIAINRQL